MIDIQKIHALLTTVLIVIVLVVGYFIYTKQDPAVAELQKQNKELKQQIALLDSSVSTRLDSIKVIKTQVPIVKNYYQKDIYHVQDIKNPDSLAAIIRFQFDKLKSPIIN